MPSNDMTRIRTGGANDSLCVLVCGGRDFRDRTELSDTLDGLHEIRRFAHMIAGGAHGADLLAEEWAEVHGVACEVYYADPMRLGRDAGRVRNERMLVEGRPELVIAFRGGRRTEHMVRIARHAGIEVIETAPRRIFAPFSLWRLTSTLVASLWTPDRPAAYAGQSDLPGPIARSGTDAPPPLVGRAEHLPGLLPHEPAAWAAGGATALKVPSLPDLGPAEAPAGTDTETSTARARDAA
jgi:hypothetical protein